MPNRVETRPILCPSDMERYAPQPRDTPRPIPSSGIYDPPYSFHKVNHQWRAHIFGQAETLLRYDAWDGNTVEDAHHAIMRFFEEVEEMKLRQNPANSCMLQASYDDGQTWSNVFDYSLCLPAPSQLEVNLTVNSAVEGNQLFNSWHDTNYTTINNLYPATNPVNTSEYLLRDARCWWGYRVAKVVGEAYAAAAEGNITQQNIIQSVFAGVGLLFAIPTFGASLGYSAASTALIVGVMGGLTWLSEATQWTLQGVSDAYRDDSAAIEVGCYLADWITNNPNPTYGDYANALVGHQLTGNAAIIANAVIESSQLTDNYRSSMMLYAQAVEASKAGIIPACICDSGTEQLIQTWDFTADDGGFVPMVVSGDDWAIYAPSSGWKRGEAGTTEKRSISIDNLSFNLPRGSYRIESVTNGLYVNLFFAVYMDRGGQSIELISWQDNRKQFTFSRSFTLIENHYSLRLRYRAATSHDVNARLQQLKIYRIL